MSKVAKLVLISIMTRVIVDENADEKTILEAIKNPIIARANNMDIGDIEDVKDDVELPYGSLDEDFKKVFNVSFFNKDEELIDNTQIDEENEELAWELFKEFGHTKKEGDYLEFGEEEEED